jgi:hypothetical protein
MAEDSVVKLRIDGEVYEIDMDELELGEVGVIEDLTDKSVQEIDWESARGLQGLVWIAMHRKDPRFTLDQAGRIKFSSFSDPDVVNGTGDGEKVKAGKRPTKAA